jgi:DNA polymerase-3 subunit epsilon
LNQPIIFIDVETTGTDPVTDRIIQFGAVIVEPDRTSWTFERLINPERPISEKARAVHRITDEMVAKMPAFRDLVSDIASLFRGRIIAGYNLRMLDLPILDEEFRRCGVVMGFEEMNIIDVFEIFRKKEPRKLEDAVRFYCRRDHIGAHGAQADAEATAEVFDSQCSRYADLHAMTLEQLAEYSQGEQRYADLSRRLYYDAEGRMCFNFGKCKDQVVESNIDYALWVLGKDFPASTKDAIKRELNRVRGEAVGV